MSLQGTFDTLAVTELFGLLSTAGKTGALRLEGADHGGREADEAETSSLDTGALRAAIFVTGGLCCGIESEVVSGRAGSEPELLANLVDVGFSLARCRSGSFRFTDAEQPPFESVALTAFEPAVAEIETLLEQWEEIEATIPSLDARVRLSPVLRDHEITLNAAEWSLLVAFDGTPTVRELISLHDEPMIEICRSLKDLVDRGAIEIGAFGDRSTGAPGKSAARVARRPGAGSAAHIEVVEPYAPASPPSPVAAEISATADAIAALERADATAAVEADQVASELVTKMTKNRRSVPDVFAEADDETADVDVVIGEPEADEVPQDRGALLRLFSALKDS